MNNPTFFEVQKWAFSCIEENGGTLEDVDYLICGQMGWDKTQLLMNYRTRIDDKNYQELQEKIELYNQDYPLQYLIGYQDFYGLRLKVTKDTLIPRPETEELVDWILNDNSKNENYDVLDVGTGTGAIGLALKSIRSNWNIFLSDISEPALKVAKENAQNLNLDVSFYDFFDFIGLCSCIYLINAFLPIPGSSGGSEGVYLLLFSFLGPVGVSSSMFLWRFMSYYMGLIIGALVFSLDKEINRTRLE